jgi:hypothetical protein
MDQIQNMRMREDVMKEYMTVEELVIQEVLSKLIEITHLPIPQGNFMHFKIP